MEASQRIDQYVVEIADWRGERLAQLRQWIHEVDPEVIEEWKWDTPVFTHGGMVCALGVFKDHIKINFFKGASLDDPNGLFNAGLEAKATRAIDIYEDDALDEKAIKALLAQAVAFNMNKKK